MAASGLNRLENFYSVRVWLVCLIFLACGCAPHEHLVRVMTYNIHHGTDADERPTLSEVAELIAEHDVDVVGLQEVDRHWSERSGFADQVLELADQLEMHFAFGPIYDLPAAEEGRPRREYGLAILSRYPITASHNYELTRLATIGREPELRRLPGFLMAAVDVDGINLSVFNTHLDYRPDPAVRRIEVDEMLKILEPFEAPVVLMGDFNALATSDELQPLFDEYVDVWAAVGGRGGETYPAGEPTKRIDMLLITPDVGVETAAVPVTTASDHRPVMAVLKLSRR